MEQETKAPNTAPAFWNDRYSSYITVYGDEPNAFFKESLEKMPDGKLLLPAEGEGRNAIFAAMRGWHVHAFDYSPAARSKALARAAENNLKINYSIADINDVILPSDEYDAIGLIYVHLEPEERKTFHRRIVKALKPGGHVILEAFSKDQIKNISGGPRNEKQLYDLSDLEEDFKGLLFTVSRQERIRLNEGPFHQGTADVVRILATKL